MELFPGHPIEMIATPEDLEKLYSVIKEADLIGIDTEWKPLFMCTNERVNFSNIRDFSAFECCSLLGFHHSTCDISCIYLAAENWFLILFLKFLKFLQSYCRL